MTLLLTWLVGGLLGGFFFGGLWWTVRRLASVKHPALWMLGSLLLRTSAALAGMLLVSDGQLDRLLLCLLGFVMARALVTRLATGAPAAFTQGPTQEGHRAP